MRRLRRLLFPPGTRTYRVAGHDWQTYPYALVNVRRRPLPCRLSRSVGANSANAGGTLFLKTLGAQRQQRAGSCERVPGDAGTRGFTPPIFCLASNEQQVVAEETIASTHAEFHNDPRHRTLLYVCLRRCPVGLFEHATCARSFADAIITRQEICC